MALKWMGQDGPLQEHFHPWGGYPPGVHEGLLGPGAPDILSDNDGRPRPPPVDAPKLSKIKKVHNKSITKSNLEIMPAKKISKV